MKNSITTIFFLCILCQIVGYAQGIDKSKLDSYFNTLETNNKFMGSVAVSKDGAIIYSRSIGYCDVANEIKANEHSKYRIGSISKTFTAVMVLKAVEAKKLNLNQTIDTFFPSIKNAKKITIEHLLRHRSGIHNFTDNADYLTWNTQPKTEKEMVEIIVKGGSDFEPDSEASYSNSNYVLLSYILEKTFNKSYANLLQELIIQPLGLTNTKLGGNINPSENECLSYRFIETWKTEPETDISIPLGAGGIISTPTDLTKFSDALFGGKLLKQESLNRMKTIKDNFGIGLFKAPFYDKLGYVHTGGIDGFSSVFTYFPDGNVSYALTSNGSNIINNEITIAVLSAVYNKPYDIPEFTTYDIKSEELDKFLGVYSSEDIPLKITVTKDDKTLIAQATGQPSFPLEPTNKNTFKYDKAGVVLEFNSIKNKMILKQGGGQFNYVKD